MEDEQKQNETMQQTGEKLKQGAKEQAKQARKQIIKKVIAAMAPILLKVIVIIIIAIIITTAFSKLLDLFKSSEAKEVMGGALEYSYMAYSGSQEVEKNGYKIITRIDPSLGGYKLDFSFYDEEKNEVSENKVLEDIKAKLEDQNISYSELTDTNLKIIAVLEKNGLDLSKYNQEEVKCLPMFIKAEIATQNFDLRDNKEDVNSEEVLDNDLIYGTLYVKRTNVGNNEKEKSTPLKFMEYEEFVALSKQNSESAINKIKQYFSIDEEGNLLLAKWHTTEVNVSYLDEEGKPLSKEEEEKIPEENKVPVENKYEISLLKIDYKSNINIYSLNYGLLSDLLIISQNPSFCGELCKVAFNSSIVIDYREETTINDEHLYTTYNSKNLSVDYVKYEVRGFHSVTGGTTRTGILSGIGNPSDSAVLRNNYGWNINVTHTINGNTYTYTWEYNEKNYELVYVKERREENSTWILYEKNTNNSTEGLPIQGNMDGNPEIIIGGQEEGFKNTYYTSKEENTYVVYVHTFTKNNVYDYEISKVDCWFTKYNKQYNSPKIESQDNLSSSADEGEYKNTSTNTITEQNEINNKINESSTIKAYVEDKEQNYKNIYPDAQDVKCTIKELTEEIWQKENITFKSNTHIQKDKFGSEQADTTQITFKNIKYTDAGPSFDDESQDVGFLSIYDKYLKSGEDLFLQQDAEKMLFDMLEDNDKTEVYSNLIKYLLYSYDHIDRGVTDLTAILDLFKVKDFKKVKLKGSAVDEVLKSYEYEILREYRSGDNSKEQYLMNQNHIRFNEDGELEYNLYELNVSGDHSLNYSYGIRVYGFEDGKYGNESVFDEIFNSSGLIKNKVQEWFNTGNAWLNADLVDKVKILITENKRDEIDKDYKNFGMELTSNELDALIVISYGFGNSKANRESVELLNRYKQGNATRQEVISNFYIQGDGFKFHPFTTSNWVKSGRAKSIINMFFDNEYYLSTGERIDPNAFFGDGILYYAKMIHDYMSDPAHLYFYCLNGREQAKMEHIHEGLPNCGIASSFEDSTKPGQRGYRLTCCATYVSWVLEEAGLIETHYNGCEGLDGELSRKGWIKIEDYSELEPGDIVYLETDGIPNNGLDHVQIYVGDGCWYNAGDNGSIHTIEPYYKDKSASFIYARRQP